MLVLCSNHEGQGFMNPESLWCAGRGSPSFRFGGFVLGVVTVTTTGIVVESSTGRRRNMKGVNLGSSDYRPGSQASRERR